MEITEIRIKLMEASEDRLRAFCSITIDNCFVVRDLKIIDGTSGPFVAMPSRKLAGHCPRCGYKNHLRASYCNHCGVKLAGSQEASFDSPQKLYADVAHPINSQCRELIQNAVIEEFESELRRAAQPGYRSRYDDEFDDDDVDIEPPSYHRDEASSEPKRPHFAERPERESASHEARRESRASESRGGEGTPRGDQPSSEDDDSSFGAGVF